MRTELLTLTDGHMPPPDAVTFDGTLGSLIRCYLSDLDSPFRKLRYPTRRHYRTLLTTVGDIQWVDAGIPRFAAFMPISEIKARHVLRWHEIWHSQGKVAMAHAVIAMLRIVCSFGRTLLESDDCARLSDALSHMRFQMPKPRTVNLTAAQATAIRFQAHAQDDHSIAMAQAFQFELMLRQKDVIGELLPKSEPVASNYIYGDKKWLRGIRWEEIDANLILTHVTSKRQKEISVALTNAPMVMEELTLEFGEGITRASLPSSGPIIVDNDGIPYDTNTFRRHWRRAADAVGVPREVRNMDTRAGAITEATDAGVPLEHARIAATHSDIQMTQKYSRGDQNKIASVMQQRVDFRRNSQGHALH